MNAILSVRPQLDPWRHKTYNLDDKNVVSSNSVSVEVIKRTMFKRFICKHSSHHIADKTG